MFVDIIHCLTPEGTCNETFEFDSWFLCGIFTMCNSYLTLWISNVFFLEHDWVILLTNLINKLRFHNDQKVVQIFDLQSTYGYSPNALTRIHVESHWLKNVPNLCSWLDDTTREAIRKCLVTSIIITLIIEKKIYTIYCKDAKGRGRPKERTKVKNDINGTVLTSAKR